MTKKSQNKEESLIQDLRDVFSIWLTPSCGRIFMRLRRNIIQRDQTSNLTIFARSLFSHFQAFLEKNKSTLPSCYSCDIKSSVLFIQVEDLTKSRETPISWTILTCKAQRQWCNKICKHICCFWQSFLWQERESHLVTQELIFSLIFFPLFPPITVTMNPLPDTNHRNAFSYSCSGNATKQNDRKGKYAISVITMHCARWILS